jgi:hypothetical protein
MADDIWVGAADDMQPMTCVPSLSAASPVRCPLSTADESGAPAPRVLVMTINAKDMS